MYVPLYLKILLKDGLRCMSRPPHRPTGRSRALHPRWTPGVRAVRLRPKSHGKDAESKRSTFFNVFSTCSLKILSFSQVLRGFRRLFSRRFQGVSPFGRAHRRGRLRRRKWTTCAWQRAAAMSTGKRPCRSAFCTSARSLTRHSTSDNRNINTT